MSMPQGTCTTCRRPQRRLPKRIILVRHGESMGNLDTAAYTTTPDYKIPLTPLGFEQARRLASAYVKSSRMATELPTGRCISMCRLT
ncbi:hypothetical protein HPP92_027332 [Vanilla planifolia]|uniref:Uncharacterized protein n=1 Tax=Vanilla planifolia TaxID=51239 RepID=A0A835U6A9_VANPL|nr:hypothetical protein HPP92_027332 [Vanilla planifolia]